ncbi:MAG: glycosyltransferase family 39 protein [Chloroflexi bacterium]|nr:glycosyltransferase family 39 protein [Chloroflexota bacterium]
MNALDRRSFGLLLLILLAAALRFYRLDAQDIWGDEAFSISLSQQSLEYVIAGGADTHPPFYPALLFFWLKLMGTSAFATRALSALIGILAVPLIFVFARRVAPARPRVAWLAAILAAVSPLLIYYSQETRMYELVAVLSLASLTLLAKEMKSEVKYLLVTLLALYTHYSAFFVLAAQNVFVFANWLRNRGGIKRWILLQLALAAAYVPWIVVQTSFLRGKASTRFDEWGWRGIEMIFGKTFLAFGVGLTTDFPIAQIAAAVFLGLAVIGVFVGARGSPVGQPCAERSRSIAKLSYMSFIVPVVIAWLVNPVMPFFFERYVLVALPGFYVTVALGLDYFARRSAPGTVGVMAALVLVSAFSLSNHFYDDAYVKGKYGRMMAYIASQQQPGDALILNNPLQKPLFDYYQPRGLPAFYLPDGVPLEDPRTRQQLADIAREHPRLWLVMFGNPAEYDPTGYLERWLGAHAFKSWSRGFVDASAVLYVMPNTSPAIRSTMQATLGENIRFVGYEVDRAEIAPGQTLQLTLHWNLQSLISSRLKVFTHLIGGINPATESSVWAQMDGEPVGGSRPTSTWQVDETIDDLYGLQLPLNIPPGEYTLEIGMYDPVTLARLPVQDASGARMAEDRVVLGTIVVKAR